MYCQRSLTTRFKSRFSNGRRTLMSLVSTNGRGHRTRLPNAAPIFSFSTLPSSDNVSYHEVPSLATSNVLQERIRLGELRHDDAQERAARRLTRLQKALMEYKSNEAVTMKNNENNESIVIKDEEETEIGNEINKNKSELKNNDQTKTFEKEEESHEKRGNQVKDDPVTAFEAKILVPRGLFLHGDVGTGKSMLMDTFFAGALVEKKRRVHFHSFMQDVHRRIHELKQLDLQTHGRSFHVDISQERNPIYRVAQQLSSEVTLLCFDEFQVTDVADALILSQLFSVLFANGTVMVATSNRPPLDLYEGGINRSYFLPYIDLLERHCIVHQIQSTTDYRRLLSEDLDQFFLVDTDADFCTTQRSCDETFERLLDGGSASRIELNVGFNRSLAVKQAHPTGLVGRFDFDELCKGDLGSSDYRSVAQHFSIVILERVPVLTLKEHDQARRFITLVDELYEGKCALLCSAVAHPDHLFVNGYHQVDPSKPSPEVSDIELKVGEAFGIDVAQGNGKTAGELASVRELSFAFKRASSRLTEMCSRQWWDSVMEDAYA